jgi:CubicO group peptidase (beta-lactamase class C family)
MNRVLLQLGITIFLVSCALTKIPETGEIDFNSYGVTSDSEISTDKYSILERMKSYNVPGASIAVVVNGKLEWAKGFGIANSITGQKVSPSTLFQAGSISKPIAALAVLNLTESNKVDLDEDVNLYLNDWKVSENEFTAKEKVTLRRLLTHTAGTTVHGFPGYRQKDVFPEIQDVLNGNGNTDEIYVNIVPGSVFRYSGGGYTIVEKVVEDISGLSFEEYMNIYIFKPLDMKMSTYQQPLPPELHAQASAAYYRNGKIVDGLWNNYPEQAAAGLWTTPSDLAKYVIEIQDIYSGSPTDFLSKDTIDLMLTMDKNGWGLGPRLSQDYGSLTFHHDGKNAGFTNRLLAFVSPKNAVIIMTNGDNGGKLIGEIQSSIFGYYGWQ